MSNRSRIFRLGGLVALFSLAITVQAPMAFASEEAPTAQPDNSANAAAVAVTAQAEPEKAPTAQSSQSAPEKAPTAQPDALADTPAVAAVTQASPEKAQTAQPNVPSDIAATTPADAAADIAADADAGAAAVAVVAQSAPERASRCPADENKRIKIVDIAIDGESGYETLEGNVQSGKSVEVTFEVAKGCTEQEVSLAGYEALSGEWDDDEVNSQVLDDFATGKFDAGRHSLTITAPECFFQVDFVRGPVIKKIGNGEGRDGLYDERKIDWDNGGEACEPTEEDPAEEEPVEEEPVAPPTTTTTTTTIAPVAVEVPVEVKDVQIATDPPADPPAEAAPAELAYSGARSQQLAMVALGMLASGLMLLFLASSRSRRAAITLRS